MQVSVYVCVYVCISLPLSLCACMNVCVSAILISFTLMHSTKFFFRSFEDHLSRSCTIFKTNAYLTPTVQQF